MSVNSFVHSTVTASIAHAVVKTALASFTLLLLQPAQSQAGGSVHSGARPTLDAGLVAFQTPSHQVNSRHELYSTSFAAA